MRIKPQHNFYYFRATLLLAFIFIVFSSCKKEEKDTILPNAQFISPFSNSLFSVYDTFNIILEVSDETQLKKLEVYFKDEFDNSVLESYSRQLSEKNQKIEIEVVINDYKLESGNYTIYADVYDEINRKTIALPIYINGTPNYLKSIYGQFYHNSTHTIKQFDSSFNFISNIYESTALFSFESNSYHQHYYICTSSLLKCFDISNQQLLWQNQINGINNSSCVNDNNSIFVSLINGNCAEYSHQGSLRRSYLCNEINYKVNYLLECGNYLIVNLKHATLANNYKTIIFEKGTSIIKQVLNDNFIYKKAFFKSEYEIYFILETGNLTSQLVKWNSLTNTFTTVFISSSTINDAAQIDSDNLFFCCSDGSLKQINLTSLTIFQLSSGKIYDQIYFSDLNQKLYGYSQTGIDILLKQNLNLINQQTISFTDSLVKLKLLNLK